MYARYIKFAIIAAIVALIVWLFYLGWIGTAILCFLPLLIVILSLIRNEHVIIALFHMRKERMEKAKAAIERIKHPEALPKSQEAYVYYIKALVGQQTTSMSKTESMLRKAINTGLKQPLDKAVAKMNLAAIAIQKRRKREAMNLLTEAKKLDKDGMLNDQIKMLKKNMGRI